MALYKALVSFSGSVSMAVNEVKELTDEAIIGDLTRAGYIEPVKEEKPKRRTRKTEE